MDNIEELFLEWLKSDGTLADIARKLGVDNSIISRKFTELLKGVTTKRDSIFDDYKPNEWHYFHLMDKETHTKILNATDNQTAIPRYYVELDEFDTAFRLVKWNGNRSDAIVKFRYD